MVKNIAVVGSGLVGVVLALMLKKQGYHVVVYDKSCDIRTLDFKGRSINLALSDRGWRILTKIGIADQVKEIGIPMYQRAIHTLESDVKYQPYSINGDAIWAISRGDLNKHLITIAEEAGIVFQFETPIWDIDLEKGVLYTAKEESMQWSTIKHDLIIGADGAYSRVRARLQKQSRFEYQQSYLPLGYKELIIDATKLGEHKLEPNSFHIWPRKDFMLIGLANVDGSFTCTLFMPFEGEVSFDNIKTEKEITSFFATYFPEVTELIPTYKEQFLQNPVNSLVTMKCFPWIHKSKVALIGDAAHAVVPFYGQGLNAGLEDVFVLSEILDEQDVVDWEVVLKSYQAMRKPNGDAIAELSYQNFREMSELTADDSFLLRKKIEGKFASLYPSLWLPLYDRVTFSTDTYVSALKMGKEQSLLMDKIMAIDGIESKWDSEDIMNQIKIMIESR